MDKEKLINALEEIASKHGGKIYIGHFCGMDYELVEINEEDLADEIIKELEAVEAS